MKKLAIVLLLCGSVPASAAAQSAGAPVVRSGWSLEKVKQKQATQQTAAAQPAKAGPAVPAPQKIKLPRAKTAARSVGAEKPKRVNGAPVMGAVARKRNQ